MDRTQKLGRETLATLRQLRETTVRLRDQALERGDDDFAAHEARQLARLDERIEALEDRLKGLADHTMPGDGGD